MIGVAKELGVVERRDATRMERDYYFLRYYLY